MTPFDHLQLRGGFSIAGQQDRDVAVDDPHGDGAVVNSPVSRAGWTTSIRRFHMMHLARPRLVIPCLRRQDRIERGLERTRGINVSREPDVCNGKRLEDLGELSDVIGVGMGAHEKIDALHPGRPEVGDDIVPIVSACIDQKCKVRTLNERRISLPHVDKVDLEPILRTGADRRAAGRLNGITWPKQKCDEQEEL